MVGPLTLYAVLVAGMVVFFAAAYVYYESQTAVGRPFRKRGVTPAGLTVAVVLTLTTVAALWLLGSTEVLHPEADLRVVGVRVLAISFPLVVGLVGLNAGYTLARRWRRLHPDNDVPTGDLAPGTVACTGTVTTAATGAGPVTGREAVCWSWRVEVQNPHGDPTTPPARQSTTVDGGDGGVVFTVDDGSGPVAVDPSDATLDLVSTRSLSFDADSGPDRTPTSPSVRSPLSRIAIGPAPRHMSRPDWSGLPLVSGSSRRTLASSDTYWWLYAGDRFRGGQYCHDGTANSMTSA